jgi:signal recognition particle receptor subunit alpha
VVFPALLPLTYIPALLQRTKQLFLSLFQPYLESLVDALSDRSGPLAEGSRSALRILGQQIVDQRWDAIFDRCLKNQEATSGRKGGRAIPVRQAQLANAGAESTSWRIPC